MPAERGIAITGADGFVGRNLSLRLVERGETIRSITRHTDPVDARAALAASDVIFHLAGANRPDDPTDFQRSNVDLTATLAEAVSGGRTPFIVFASSVKAAENSPYGRSKQAAEKILLDLAKRGEARAAIFRLPNVFGKWARPHYNSAVATFCHNIARGLPIRIDDPDAPLALLYIDDLIDQWLALLDAPATGLVEPLHVHHSHVGAVAAQITAFAQGRSAGMVGRVGTGLERALYATYVAALPPAAFTYPLAAHRDPRGSFCEMLKTPESGQISCLTAHPGVTRGGHYHHSKIEKFLVVHGTARFRFRNLRDGASYEVNTSADQPAVVETIPGWTHDITNIGDDVLVALLWASEVFDPTRPDTIALPL
jgi:UDP-2-acetamido-2,6-beta-L-arabino-hexul-4-ose reductase